MLDRNASNFDTPHLAIDASPRRLRLALQLARCVTAHNS
jgi:hypothetical protein